MKSKITLFLSLLILAVILYLLFRPAHISQQSDAEVPIENSEEVAPPTPEPTTDTQAPTSPPQNQSYGTSVDIIMDSLNDETSLGAIRYKKSVQWPVLSGNAPPEVLSMLNDLLKGRALSSANNCNPASEGDVSMTDYDPEYADHTAQSYRDDVTTTAEIKGPDLLYVEYTITAECGQVRVTTEESWYDLKTGRSLDLPDLFEDPTFLPEELKKQITDKINQSGPNCRDIISAPDCQTRYINGDGLLIRIGGICLAPDELNCAVEAKMNFQDFRSFIKANSPFLRLFP